MSPNESEPQHFPEASTAEFTPQAPGSSKPSTSSSPLGRAGTWATQVESMFVRRLLVVGVLGILVMIGLFLSNYSSEKARFYWCAMFPIFGAACLAHELAAGRAYEIALWRILMRQALHWIGPIVAVKILFMQHTRGQMATDAVALTIILLLAVTCFLAGVHFGPQLLLGQRISRPGGGDWHRDRNLSLVRCGAAADRNRDRGAVSDTAAPRLQGRRGARPHFDLLTTGTTARWRPCAPPHPRRGAANRLIADMSDEIAHIEQSVRHPLPASGCSRTHYVVLAALASVIIQLFSLPTIALAQRPQQIPRQTGTTHIAQDVNAARNRVESTAAQPTVAPPIQGVKDSELHDSFYEIHDGHRHEAIDISEPEGTPVHAVVDGRIRKLFFSKAGGNTIYEFDREAYTVTTTRIWSATMTDFMMECPFREVKSSGTLALPATRPPPLLTCTSRSTFSDLKDVGGRAHR